MVEGVESWRVPRAHVAGKAAGALVLVVVAAFARDAAGVLLAGVAAAAVAGIALRDVLVPVRLAADDGGVTVVAGLAGRRRLAWGEIEEIRVDERRRGLVRSRLLEIRADDDLHLLSAFDLGSDVATAADALTRRWRAQTGSSSDAAG
ncbi:PH domain-containing protein [Actinomadura atramentaria]|uniref:PH domain-containing protein n=1 Tax=Actinomadura atramentaria TaxID=1990 RepID=UPI0005246F1E|nr:PH domain-containing protein [Actinomadura atramentaria]